jgi:AcrR family transcriptional regulator
MRSLLASTPLKRLFQWLSSGRISGMPQPTEAPEGSPRRQELLHRTLQYAADHNLSDLSLRPLAAAIGSSPRVLLYLFGSKENLLREVTAAERRQQLEIFEAAAAAGESREALTKLWEWISDPQRTNLSRLFFENYVRSLDGAPGFEQHAAKSVQAWLAPIGELLAVTDPGDEHPPATATEPPIDQLADLQATLALAVLRGLVLDLLASDDRERVQATWNLFLDMALDPLPPQTSSTKDR